MDPAQAASTASSNGWAVIGIVAGIFGSFVTGGFALKQILVQAKITRAQQTSSDFRFNIDLLQKQLAANAAALEATQKQLQDTQEQLMTTTAQLSTLQQAHKLTLERLDVVESQHVRDQEEILQLKLQNPHQGGGQS